MLPTDPLDVLVVDDNADVRTSFASILRTAGHVVDEAADGQKALERLYQVDCKVLMMDMDMPNGGGMELLASLQHRRTPLVLVVTASDLPFERLHSMPNRVFGYLRKPVFPPHLRSVVAEAIATAAHWP